MKGLCNVPDVMGYDDSTDRGDRIAPETAIEKNGDLRAVLRPLLEAHFSSMK